MARDVEQYKVAERQLWESVGVEPELRTVTLASGHAVRIHEVGGSGTGTGPPLLFIHGVGSSGAIWAPLVAELAGFRCLVLDRPGCGLGEPLPSPPRTTAAFKALADSLVPDVVAALGLDSVSVVATSFGGYFGVRGAAARPDLIHRLIGVGYLVGVPLTKLPMSMRLGTIPGAEALTARIPPTRGAVRMILRQIGLKRALASGAFSSEMFEWFYTLLRHTDTLPNEQRATPPRMMTPIRGQNPDIIFGPDVLDQLTMPSLFIWGDEDPMGSTDVAHQFVPKVPDARLEMVAEAGHAPWIDEPQLVGRLITDFLNGG